jgi:hypothetical protein
VQQIDVGYEGGGAYIGWSFCAAGLGPVAILHVQDGVVGVCEVNDFVLFRRSCVVVLLGRRAVEGFRRSHVGVPFLRQQEWHSHILSK